MLNDQFGMTFIRSVCIIICIIIVNIFEKAHDYFYQNGAMDFTLFYACPYVDLFHNGDMGVWVRRAFRSLICCLMTMALYEDTLVSWIWRIPYRHWTCISTSGCSWANFLPNGVMLGVIIILSLSLPANFLILVFFSEIGPFQCLLISLIEHPPEKNRPKWTK